MNFNLSTVLSSSMRILNIANKAIPLIKEVNPAIQTVKTKLTTIKKKSSLPIPNKVVSSPQNKESINTPIAYQNNSLTFFK